MLANKLVARLEHCLQTGPSKWIARCPSHEDRSPSLSISEQSDGRVLIHCHAGCGALDVLTAVGLDYDALFPEKLDSYTPRGRRAPQETVDGLVIEIAEHDRALGKRLSKADTARYREALKRQAVKTDVITEMAREMGFFK